MQNPQHGERIVTIRPAPYVDGHYRATAFLPDNTKLQSGSVPRERAEAILADLIADMGCTHGCIGHYVVGCGWVVTPNSEMGQIPEYK